jgi:hypothetical protein
MKTLQEEWDDTNQHLDWLNRRFISLHEKNQKEWTDTDHYAAREYREGARSTGEYRYWILERARKEGIQIK